MSVGFVNGTIARLVSTWKIVNTLTLETLALDEQKLWKHLNILLRSMRVCFGTQEGKLGESLGTEGTGAPCQGNECPFIYYLLYKTMVLNTPQGAAHTLCM